MYAVIKNGNGETAAVILLAGDDALDCDIYANQFADSMGVTLDPSRPGAAIPDGCEDYSVTLQDEPGSVVCWNSANYMVAE